MRMIEIIVLPLENKRLVKRFQLISKCKDTEEAWSYMRQQDFNLDAALEQYWSDVAWESKNPLVSETGHGADGASPRGMSEREG